jgi:hypothetical protein
MNVVPNLMEQDVREENVSDNWNLEDPPMPSLGAHSLIDEYLDPSRLALPFPVIKTSRISNLYFPPSRFRCAGPALLRKRMHVGEDNGIKPEEEIGRDGCDHTRRN